MKHRTINRITSWAFALAAIFAVALAFGMVGSAYGLSDNDYENVNGSGGEAGSISDVTFVHTLKASAAADLTGIVYTVSATPTDLSALYAADRPVGVRDVPSVSGTPISGSFDIALSGASATAPDAGSTSEVKTYTAGKSLAELFGDADAFGQPGVYIFDVAETHAGGSSTDASTWAYGNETYRIRVYVVNDPNAVTDTDLAYDGWTVEALSNNDKVSQMAFTSTYSAWRSLDISKAVAGDFGDKTYEFPFEVTVILPEWYDGTTPLTLDNMTQTTAPAQTGGAGPWTGVYQTSLHNGEHASITVPVGTYYKIDEKSAAAASEPGNVVDGVGMEYSVNIDWSVSQASGGGTTPTIPTSLSTASLGDLQMLSSQLREGTVQPSAVSELIGQTVSVTLADNSTATARLVDATAARGLVFQFDYNAPISTGKINTDPTNAGGWTDSAMRTNLNSGGIYTNKLDGMTIAGETVTPVPTTLKSLDRNGGTPQVITTTGDKFWLPSVAEVYGPSAWATLNLGGYTGTEDGTQFAYYATLNPSPTDTSTNPLASSSWWWLRSAAPTGSYYFMYVNNGGNATDGNVTNNAGSVAPCFCL